MDLQGMQLWMATKGGNIQLWNSEIIDPVLKILDKPNGWSEQDKCGEPTAGS